MSLTLLGPLLKMAGISEEELKVYVRAGENRLRDLRAFALGGQLSDGTDLPGQKALYESNLALQKVVLDLAADVAKLAAKTEAPHPPASAPVPVAKVASPTGKKTGKSATKEASHD